MSCIKPIVAYKLMNQFTEKGKSVIKFKLSECGKNPYEVVKFSCGNCKLCRMERAREWGVRCYHESLMYNYNCFLTLTYSDECMPEDNSLNKKDIRRFIKKLRGKYQGVDVVKSESNNIRPIRYLQCGEYGDLSGRPHHHVALFNFDFDDKIIYKRYDTYNIYTSEKLNKLWSKRIRKEKVNCYDPVSIFKEGKKVFVNLGYCIIGDLTFESACYIARYIMKKVNGKEKDEHYKKINKDTGEVYQIEPEYITMSRKPGIGKSFYEKFGKTDINDNDVKIFGKGYRIPKYYDTLLEKEEPERMASIRLERRKEALKKPEASTVKKGIVKNKIFESQQKLKGKRL